MVSRVEGKEQAQLDKKLQQWLASPEARKQKEILLEKGEQIKKKIQKSRQLDLRVLQEPFTV